MDQLRLFDPPQPPQRGAGRHEKMVRKALEEAETRGTLTAVDGAAISLAIANAWALDEAEHEGQPFAVAQITAPFIELMKEIGLIQSEVSTDDDKLALALQELSSTD